jgi:thioredoxin reductase (NADPH)
MNQHVMSDKIQSYNVVIVGGGPAGMSGALWCADLKLKCVVLERESEFGGQLLTIYNPITNYLGLQTRNGREMHERFIQQLENRAIDLRNDVKISEVELTRKTVTTDSGDSFAADAIIIATGVRRRELGIPGEHEFADRGVLESGSKERELTSGKRVVIIGGGDAALENALILSDSASEVIVAHRRATFSARREFIEAASQKEKVRFLMETEVVSINGREHVESVDTRDASGTTSTILCDYVLLRIGVTPNSELFTEYLQHDRGGYLIVDSESKTSASGIYSIGDVANPVSPTIATAVGTGAAAVKTILRSLPQFKH